MFSSSDVFDDSDEEYYLAYMTTDGTDDPKPKHGGSTAGRRANKEREREIWGERLMKDYFGENPTYDHQYLRKPTPDDLEDLLVENVERGFPGMIGSLDCMHWCWKNCPTGWQGAFQGKEKTSTVILEAVASKSLWIWHAFFGMPGANNDLNVLERSPLLNDQVNGIAPQVQFTVNGATYEQAYYLTDGIYPAWAIFQSSIRAPQGNKHKRYAIEQEAVRKDVERTFGVLQQRFRIIALPCKLWKMDAMNDVVLACIILHNMIVEGELPFSSLSHEYLLDDNWVSPARAVPATESPVTTLAKALCAIEDEVVHFELKNDLIEHVWRRFGENE